VEYRDEFPETPTAEAQENQQVVAELLREPIRSAALLRSLVR
jgi:hypothetical protein